MRLKVNHNSIDYTLKMFDFSASSTDFDLSSESVFIGSDKPLKAIYIEMEAREDGENEISELTVKHWNGSQFIAFEQLNDQTFGLLSSGPVTWSEDIDQEKTDYDNSGEKYWLELSVSTNPVSVLINGINLVLSDDKDLGFVPNVSDFLPTGSTSFIAFHQEARDIIVQTLRNSGKKIAQYEPNDAIDTRQVEVFDLLDIEEFRNASKYLTLHLIYDHISKSNEDVYFQKSQRYHERFLNSFNSNLITLDLDANGKTDAGENQAVQFIRIKRE